MLVVSDLLSIFKRHAGVLEASDGNIIVPPAVLPVATIPKTQRVIWANTMIGTSTDPVAESFMASSILEVANAAQAQFDFIWMAPGLWEVELSGYYGANFNAVAGSIGVHLLAQWGGRNTAWVRTQPYSGSGCSWERRFLLALDETLFVQHILGTSGVGQIHFSNVSITANRLL